ncbi:hypothetical protein KI387_017406, partial [Taxus chinensis]
VIFGTHNNELNFGAYCQAVAVLSSLQDKINYRGNRLWLFTPPLEGLAWHSGLFLRSSVVSFLRVPYRGSRHWERPLKERIPLSTSNSSFYGISGL